MNNQKGFTLIELIVVIVILGILSAVAVPKFVDMQGEARRGVLEGIRGSWKSAVMMSHGKWLALGNSPASITVEGKTVEMTDGYPTASTENLADLIDLDGLTVIDTDSDEFSATVTSGALYVNYGDYTFVYGVVTTDAPPVTSKIAEKTP
ncbi:type II secretion system protein [uncultured Desulfuromonas sp.]|uniref:type II secretion system protein n=1 Tax=uncultured Desulfuromonas sp. TaxID=181013 RepID=UPI002AABF589|nr:type II secretion system protein [uncultured Desulfuromonas sp.]